MEEWKDIKGYEGLYQVSNYGRVKSLDRLVKSPSGFRKLKGKVLKTYKAGAEREYDYIKLHKNNITEPFSIHRLVAETFLDNPSNKPQVDHIIPISCGGTNCVENLRWCTQEENCNNKLTRNNCINNPKLSTKIYQYSKENELICIYPSLHEAERNGFGRKEIKKCCLGELKTHKGYKWSSTPL